MEREGPVDINSPFGENKTEGKTTRGRQVLSCRVNRKDSRPLYSPCVSIHERRTERVTLPKGAEHTAGGGGSSNIDCAKPQYIWFTKYPGSPSGR